MKRLTVFLLIAVLVFLYPGIYLPGGLAEESDASIRLVPEHRGPEFLPRPYKDATGVPLRTSFYIRLYIEGGSSSDTIESNSIEVQLIPGDGEPVIILGKNSNFASGYSGFIIDETHSKYGNIKSIFIDTNKELMPSTLYTIKVSAKTAQGYEMLESDASWQFTTAPEVDTYEIKHTFDFTKEHDVSWQGRYFNGFVRTAGTYKPDNMARFDFIYSQERKEKYPNAWSLTRYEISSHDFFHTGIIDGDPSNIVREKETRRIISMTDRADGILLKVENFFGHEQYGIPTDAPLSNDFKPGDEIVIGDGTNNVNAFVISTNDADKTVLVSKFDHPEGGWEIDYYKPLPTEEDPYAPGLFPRGGTYLYKFNPCGTPVYYFDRLDAILDTYVIKYNQRMSINIVEAFGDLSIDGRIANVPKDYVEFHQATYDIVSHIIDRYGDRTLTWVWSIFNEPDLMSLYWRSRDWIALQKFYDYAVDAVLKAFEDKGYDSDLVIIGGLELGGIAGTNLKLHDFLAHCSPTAVRDSKDYLGYNAAYADPRLDGKRSRRVEELCKANNGKGTPLDFVSIHTYNDAEMAAAKIIHTKTVALEIDPDYYSDLWVNNFESVPTWSGFNDPGYSEWTLANGYFSTWAADYFCRMLNKAMEDPRYAYGEGVLTLWGWAMKNFDQYNDVAIEVTFRRGTKLYKEIIPRQIFHYVNLVSTMDTNYWVIPQQTIAGNNVSGFAAQGEDDYRMVLYSHNIHDPQCRADHKYNFDLELKGLTWDKVKVTEYHLDRVNNTYYPFAVENKNAKALSEKQFEKLKEMSQLKVSNETVYEVGADGILNLDLPVAANGVNFIIISDAEDDTTPGETPEPGESPDETPTSDETPDETPTPGETPVDSPTPGETPVDTPNPGEIPDETPGLTPDETPDNTPDDTPTIPDDKDPAEPESPAEKPPKTGSESILAAIILMLAAGAVIIALRLRKRTKIV